MAEADLRQALEKRREISITVTGRRTGNAITLPVWFVLEDETVWLLPVRGSRSQWFRNLQADPTVTVRAGRGHFTATARLVTDPHAVQAVVQRFRSKYSPAEVVRYYTGFDAAIQLPITSRPGDRPGRR
jgi:deazaflavin-dependent oxidoreductase (nitroreductase family)